MNYKLLLLLLTTLFLGPLAQAQENPLSLAGEWSIKLDPDNLGEQEQWAGSSFNGTIQLPGTTDEAQMGEKTSGSDYGILTRAYKYIGPAWYQREIVIPKNLRNKNIELFLERVLWESKVWIDGKQCDTQDGLGVPHRHQLGKLSPGKHTLTVRVNNDMIHNIGDKGHTYSEYTQSIWNGIVGKIELRAAETVHIDRLKTWPDVDKNELTITFDTENEGKETKVNYHFQLTDLSSGEVVLDTKEKATVTNGSSESSFNFKIDQPVKKWDEFTPNLYELSVTAAAGKARDTKQTRFGFRKVGHSKSKVLINDQPVFMRGNLDCVHFPLTGYPSCDPAEWERIFKIYKSYGLNHVRFHSWCPPEAAFIAADKLGLYLQAEILWIDWWMTSAPEDRPDMYTKGLPEGLGKNPSADAYVQAEMQRMLDAYGNHPSFTMFCIGNELGNSDFDAMQQWVEKAKNEDNRRLYSVSTARKIMPVDQYMATHNIPGVGRTYGVSGYTTDFDLEKHYSQANIPIIAHEVGQFPVYPLWSEIDKYTGVLKARNLEECRESAKKNHLLGMNRQFHEASGAIQDLLYKAHVENLFRTESCAGFQLLSMQDYQGQGEALVGWLDCFWDAKGNTTPESFRRYSNTVVPLARFEKFVWENQENFSATLQVANYGPTSLQTTATWQLTSALGQLIQQGTIDDFTVERGVLKTIGEATFSLDQIQQAGKYTFSITLNGTEFFNSWDLWIYPPVTPEQEEVLTVDKITPEVLEFLKNGGKVLLYASELGTSTTSRPIYFTPLFWSSVFFPGQANSTLGLYVNQAHPALAGFPTDNFSHYQWQTISKGRSFVLNDHPNLLPVAQPISDFHINDKLGSIFECQVGTGKLMVCGYAISDDSKPVARQLKHSLLSYMNQSNFNPSYQLSEDEIEKLFYFVQPAVSQAPEGFEDAILYVKSGANRTATGSKEWKKSFDKILVQKAGCDYDVAAHDTWNDGKESAWTGREMTVKLKTPNGIIGNLFVRFTDPNKQNRAGTIWIEGREMMIDNIGQDGKWVKLFVMREDTNDGEVVLKTKVQKGGNLMISEIGLIAE